MTKKTPQRREMRKKGHNERGNSCRTTGERKERKRKGYARLQLGLFFFVVVVVDDDHPPFLSSPSRSVIALLLTVALWLAVLGDARRG